MMEVIKIKNLSKLYDDGMTKALTDVNFSVEKGEFVSIMGPSGCGKSTLMNIIGSLDRADDGGQVQVAGYNLMDHKDKSRFRSEKVGFIFQSHNLIPTLSLIENVQTAMIGSVKRGQRKKRAKELLVLVGLEHRLNSLPTKVSGGERQRTAIARALANNPEIILADEPTGNVDSKNAKNIIEIFKDINNKGCTLVMVTHDPNVASAGNRHIHMLDGKIVKEDSK